MILKMAKTLNKPTKECAKTCEFLLTCREYGCAKERTKNFKKPKKQIRP